MAKVKDKPGFVFIADVDKQQGREFAIVGDTKSIIPSRKASAIFRYPTSSLQEYFDAKPAVDNAAGREIDNGLEPYLFSIAAWQSICVHGEDHNPFVTIYDLMIARRGKLVGVDLGKGPVYLEPDTLVVWR